MMTVDKLKQMKTQIKRVAIEMVQMIKPPLTTILVVQQMKVEMLLLIRQIIMRSQTPKIIAIHRQMTMPTRMMLKLPPMMILKTGKDLQIQQTMMLPQTTTILEIVQIRLLLKVTQETQPLPIPQQKTKLQKTQPRRPQQRKSLAHLA
jgi:hypothetical protein